jgi:hypothetical protein
MQHRKHPTRREIWSAVFGQTWAWLVTAPLSLFALATLLRDELLPLQLADKWHLRSVLGRLPHFPWEDYALIIAAVWFIAMTEAFFRYVRSHPAMAGIGISPPVEPDGALSKYVRDRQSFALWEAACLLTQTPLTPHPTSGLAAAVLIDLKRKMSMGDLTATEDSGGDYPSYGPDPDPPMLSLLEKHVANGARISRGALRELAVDRGAAIAGLTDVPPPDDDFVGCEEAGRRIYNEGSDELKRMIRTLSEKGRLDDNIMQHAIYAADDTGIQLWGRWAKGLKMEPIQKDQATLNAFDSVFHTDKSLAIDVSIKRSDLPKLLERFRHPV